MLYLINLLFYTRKKILSNIHHNLLQTSMSRMSDGIRYFLVDERLGDRIIGLVLLI